MLNVHSYLFGTVLFPYLVIYFVFVVFVFIIRELSYVIDK